MFDRAPLAAMTLIAALLAGPALAAEPEVDGVISTSRAIAPPMTTEQKIANILAAARADDAPDKVEMMGPRQVHGSAGVSVGSDGYRSAYVSARIPVGESGMVGVAYSQSQGGRGFGRGMGPGFGGPGFGGPGFGGSRDGRALGMSFAYEGERDGRDCRSADRMSARCEAPRD